MRKNIIIALVAIATVFAVSCSKEDKTFSLPGTSWAFDIEATLMGTNVVFNDTLNIIDDHNLNRNFHLAAAGREISKQASLGYTWDGTNLTLLDSVGQPTKMVLTYRESDNVFFRDAGDDEETSQMLSMMGITEVTYKQIK